MLRVRGVERGFRDHAPVSRVGGTAPRLFERRTGGLGAIATDPPAARAEPVALAGDDDGARMREHDVDTREEITVDHHRPADELVEQRVDGRIRRADVAAHSLADGRRLDSHAGGPERQNRAAHLVVAERFQSGAGGVDTVDDDGGEGFTGRGLEHGPPSLIDLDEVEQGADHAADIAKARRAGACTSLVESHRECIGSGVPRAVLGVGVSVRAARVGHRPFRIVAGRVGVLDGSAAFDGHLVEGRQVGHDAGELVFDRVQLGGVGGQAALEP